MGSVVLPTDVAYVWWAPQYGSTHLTTGNVVDVPPDTVIHMTAWSPNGTSFKNRGSCLFIIVPDSGRGVLEFGEPVEADDNSGVFNQMEIYVKDAICLNKIFWNDLCGCFRGGRLAGYNRHSIIEWEWPFCMPGWNGISAIDVPVPGWQGAMPWLEWHALGILGGRPFEALDAGAQKSAVGIAVGAIGYLTGYESEDVDDVCSQFCSMGTGNDCDDFAVAACSLVTAILKSGGNSPLSRWIVANVRKAYCVSGLAWPRQRVDDNNNPIQCGHMWCELALNDGTMMVVECTSAVAYYGGDVVCGNARTGDLDEYVTRKFFWDSKHGYRVDHGGLVGKALRTNTLPDWVSSLRFGAPPLSTDTLFSAPGMPPPLCPILGFDVYRNKTDNAIKILPFTRAFIRWRFDGYVNRNSAFGSYA